MKFRRVLMHRDLAEIRANPKATKLESSDYDQPIEQALLAPLDKYQPLINLMEKSHFPPGFAVQVLLIVVQLAGIIERATEYVRPVIAERLQKV